MTARKTERQKRQSRGEGVMKGWITRRANQLKADAAFWELVEAIVKYAGGGCTLEDLGDGIDVGDVIQLLKENTGEFDHCEQKRQAAEADCERLREKIELLETEIRARNRVPENDQSCSKLNTEGVL